MGAEGITTEDNFTAFEKVILDAPLIFRPWKTTTTVMRMGAEAIEVEGNMNSFKNAILDAPIISNEQVI
jgi:hypothetical protein